MGMRVFFKIIQNNYACWIVFQTFPRDAHYFLDLLKIISVYSIRALKIPFSIELII